MDVLEAIEKRRSVRVYQDKPIPEEKLRKILEAARLAPICYEAAFYNGIAVDHMTLVAVEEGLGSCWIGAFKQGRIKEILGIPDKYRVVVLLSLGYPCESAKRKLRKPLKEIISYDCFSK